MPVPQNLPQYLQEIQDYLELQEMELRMEYERRNQTPAPSDSFPELTQAIAYVESLKSIKEKITAYYIGLIF